MPEYNVNPTRDNQIIKVTEVDDRIVKVKLPADKYNKIITSCKQGPPGRDGQSAASYVHEQSSPSTTWTVVHNLNKYPNFSVVDSTKRNVLASIQYIDLNTLIITVAAPFAGSAYLT